MTFVQTTREFDIRFVPSAGDVADHLWSTCFPSPLEGRFWYETLERSHLEDQFVFSYAVISRGGEPVAVAPCFRHDVPIGLVAPPIIAGVLRILARTWPRVGYQRTFFVGSPCADEGTVGLVPGTSLSDVAPALRIAATREARRHGARMTVFKDFRSADANVLAGGAAPRFVSTLSYPGTVVPLPGRDREQFYRAMPHRRRHHLLKKLRRSRETLPLHAKVIVHPTPSDLDQIHGLFWQTYQRGKTKFERLGRPFFAAVAEQPEAHFLVLREPASDTMVAFMLLFRLGERVINKFIGIDYARGAQAFLYFRLFDAALDFAYACGAKELQSGQTGYRAKLDFGHRLVPLHNVFHHDSPAIHALFGAIGQRITWRSLDEDLDGQKPAPA